MTIPYHSCRVVNTVHIDSSCKPDQRAFFWVFHTTLNFQTIHPVFKSSLQKKIKQSFFLHKIKHTKEKLTLGGPMIMPVQCDRVISLSSSKPQLIVPSPTPFCPCSSSSNSRKFRGTTTSEER